MLQMDARGSAVARPDGQLVSMRLVDEQHARRDPNTISANDRILLKLRGGSSNASVSGISERNCPKTSSGNSCSSVSYQAILTVDHIGRRASLPVWGFCGCR